MEISEVFHPRRVVTGLDAQGTSRLARVEEIEPARVEYAAHTPVEAYNPTWSPPQTYYHRVWASDRLPVPLPSDGLTPPIDSSPTPGETAEHLRRAYAVPPPLGFRAAWVRGQGPGPITPIAWHDSTDIKFTMGGEQGYLFDDGTELVLRAGDVLVENGTNHAHQDFSANNVFHGYLVVGGLRVGKHPPYEMLHPVQRGPVGGHRSGEIRDKEPLTPWTAPAPPQPKYLDAGKVLSMSEVDRPRRIVAANRPDGRSSVARLEEVAPVDHPIFSSWFPIWGADRLPLYLPCDGLAPPFESLPTPDEAEEALQRSHYLPPPLGYRVGVAKLDPMERPGAMHWYDSVEIYFVMHGEVSYMVDSGDAVDLRAGDTLIQNGTNHAWHNRGDAPVWLGIGVFGAVRFGAHPPLENLHAVQRGSCNRLGERR